MVYGPPTPAAAGEKVLPVIPGPLNVPPAGVPVNVAPDALTLYVEASPLKLTVGNGLTVMFAGALVFVHPLPLV